jgi:ADP-heptose:LPS heptosyltransferase
MPTLLYHTGALGDFITILPCLDVWKNEHPNDPLTLMGRPEIGSLAVETGCVDMFVDVTAAQCAQLFDKEPSATTAEILKTYSSAIVFSAGDFPFVGHCRKLGLDVYDQPPFPSNGMHVVDYHISLFRNPFDVPQGERTPRIRVPQESREASFSLCPQGEKYAVVHVGSGSPRKNWSLDRFVRISHLLRDQGRNIVWIRGPAESSLLKAEGGADRIVENPPLSVLAAILARAEFFLGNDSGVAHLAAAAGCPSLVLFGASDPLVWAPRGEAVKILHNKVPCSPCHLSGLRYAAGRTSQAGRDSHECDRACLDGISVEQVLASILAL